MCFFLAPFLGKLGILRIRRREQDVRGAAVQLGVQRQSGNHFFIYGAADDPYVPFVKVQEFAARLGTESRAIEKGDHLNAAAAFTTVPFLLDDSGRIL